MIKVMPSPYTLETAFMVKCPLSMAFAPKNNPSNRKLKEKSIHAVIFLITRKKSGLFQAVIHKANIPAIKEKTIVVINSIRNLSFLLLKASVVVRILTQLGRFRYFKEQDKPRKELQG